MDDMKIREALFPSSEKAEKGKAVQGPLGDFQKILKDSVGELDTLLRQGDKGVQKMLLGDQDIHQTMIALEQANLSLRLMVQIRNKAISTYEEIMRMQI